MLRRSLEATRRSRDQSQLLPARVDDYVRAENPVRFIDAFVDGLDCGFRRKPPTHSDLMPPGVLI